MKNFLVIALSGLLLSSCASSQVSFFTNPPQTKVYAKPLGEGKKVLIGETPLTTPSKALADNVKSSGPLLIELEKEGYETKSMVISDLNVNNLLLNVEMRPSFKAGDQATVNWLIETSFEVRRLVKANRHDEAYRLLVEMKKVAPLVATVHELLGGVYYVRGQFKESYDSYSEALKLNPKSLEAYRMTSILKETVGDRGPASQGESP